MKNIARNRYLDKLIIRRENNMIKVITGIRRCGKSVLLFELFYDYLISHGVKKERIIKIALDDIDNSKLRDPYHLRKYIEEKTNNDELYFILLDEIQMVGDFEGLLNGLARKRNLDIYVTGSNSKFLSTDIITEFRGRGDEIRVYPLSYSEFISGFEGKPEDAWYEYFTYGGLPMILNLKTDEQKSQYLCTLFETVYIADIIDRNRIKKNDNLYAVINILASSVGSLTNSKKIADTFTSKGISGITNKTVNAYINYLIEAFMIKRVNRFDTKGRKYISTPSKYYFTDVGLRNSLLNFRQQEENHIMENIIFNELVVRGFNVDVGVVEHYPTVKNGKQQKKQLEIDFVCNQGNKRYYIQSAFSIPDNVKMEQEQNSLIKVDDSFKKIIVVKDKTKTWRNDYGITIMDIKEFLLNEGSLDL